MYWLSRQRLPRKAGMAASLGTAVHASIEDLLQVDISNRISDETHWLPDMAEGFLKTRWNEEKEIFLANGNSSVRAMIFYLVLNEILTFYSQNNLISSEVKNIAKGTFKEESDSVVITFSINIEKATSILSSKLITHLLNLENLELRLNNNQLLITQNDMRLLL